MPDGSEVEVPTDLSCPLLLRPGGFVQGLPTKLLV
jgi:hypothetical protein